jgi:ribosomal protein S18 acetylase RimI-like enzyme
MRKVQTTPVVVRAAASPGDLETISRIDTSFSCDRIYRVRRDGLAFYLDEEHVEPPVEKTYPLPSLTLSDRLFVACLGDETVGFGELEFESWNGRARIEHLYVSSAHRGRGAGGALLQALDERARNEEGVRCLLVETQNVNYPAIQFYRRSAFRLCGLDETLYRPDDPALVPGEVALFFARDVDDRI